MSELIGKPVVSGPAAPLSRGRLACAAMSEAVAAPTSVVLGVLQGEGIGPQIIEQSLRVLDVLGADASFPAVDVRTGGLIGLEAESACGRPLSEEVERFCLEVFNQNGAVLCGPGGGRFVYDLRKRFDLYCKMSPVRPTPMHRKIARFRDEHLEGVDLLIVRDNVGGLYFGRTQQTTDASPTAVLHHTFSCDAVLVDRIATAAAAVAATRNGSLACVVKQGALKQISGMWSGAAARAASRFGVDVSVIDVDHAAYQLVQNPRSLDVILAPNLFGDILIDASAVLLGSRGNTFSGNFGPSGQAVYQTNHGGAHDLVGSDKANPVGQFLSLAMALRESFGLDEAAGRIEVAIESVWEAGVRTADVASGGERVVGTRQFTDHVLARLD